MKKSLLFSAFLLFSYSIVSQSLPDYWNEVYLPCYNSQDSIWTYQGWEAYQTQDNFWDGTRDSSVCINIAQNGYGFRFDNTEFDASRPVFLRMLSTEIALWENYIYQLALIGWNYEESMDFGNQTFCNESFCTGSLIGIEIPAHPDDTTNSTAMRWYNSEFEIIPDNNYDVFYDYSHCFPTERFQNGNDLKEVVIKFLFTDSMINPFYVDDLFLVSDYQPNYFGGWYGPNLIDQFTYVLSMPYYGLSSYLVLNEDSLYPGESYYYDLSPFPNVDTIATVFLHLQNFTTITFQPFAALRGGLLIGSDSLRHNLQVINDGAEFCINMYIDVVWNAGDQYIHNTGNLDFKGETACMQFNHESTLVVGENSHLQYGDDGHGILALYNGSTIDLRTNSQIEINNHLIINDHKYMNEGEQIFIEIPQKTKLRFGKNAHITNWSRGQKTKLNFKMNGGELDLSGLDSDDLQHINLIYPVVNKSLDEITVYGNPVEDNLVFSFLSMETKKVEVSINDLQGRLIYQEDLPAQRGINFQDIPFTFKSGLYVLQVRDDKNTLIQKVLKN